MKTYARAASIAVLAALMLPAQASSQAAQSPIAAPVAAPPAASPPAPVAPAAVRLPEGTEVSLSLDDALSSATAAEGDKFSITLDQPIKLADGTVIAAGYRGKGEVSGVEKRGMMGKAGQLNVRLDYVLIGDTRVPLRANKSQEGKSNQTTTVVLTVLISPLFLLMHGKDAKIPKGQEIVGYVDSSVSIPAPVAAPPTQN